MTTVAAIDCGTNSIRLLIASLIEGELVDVDRRMRIVRLGEGVDRTGALAPQALARTQVALEEYAKAIASHGVDRIRMVATSASRDASNAAVFESMVTAVLGVAPEVVSGNEEARLSFTGAVRGLPASVAAPFLVVDIGGGSTEFVLGERDLSVTAARSVDVGCVRMTERHLVSDPPTAAQIAAATADIEVAVDVALAVVPGREAATLVGLAGSVTTVAGIALGLPAYDAERIHHARIPFRRVAEVSEQLLAMDKASRLTLPVMHPGRADVIGAGALILKVLMARVGADSVVASEHDILDGIAWSVAQ